MKSFQINNSMRADVAKQLTTQAIKVELLKIVSDLKAINTEFWDRHTKKVLELGLPKEQWDHLIQEGVVRSTISCLPYVTTEDSRGAFQPCLLSKQDLELFNSRVDNKKITGLDDFMSHQYQRCYVKLKAPRSYPEYNGYNSLPGDDQLNQRLLQAVSRFQAAMKAANEFYVKTLSVLNSCRTSRQLEDLFPEAAKLLPRPEPKSKTELAPVELVTNLKQMMDSGIPPVN